MDSPDLLKKKTPSVADNPTQDSTDNGPALKRATTHPWRRVIIVLILAFFGVAGILGYKAYTVSNRVLANEEGMSFFAQLKTLISAPEKPLKGEDEGRINVLLMGFGGSGHQGAYLTDTMIIASFKPQSKEVAMLSLPRDLFVDIPGYGYRKINNAFAFGHTEDSETGGETLAQATVQSVAGLSIHYYAWIDFTGFEKIIDDVGGIEIAVDQTFVDYSYPTEDFGYQTVRFEEGLQTMDGDTALKYVRSRKGTNGEGSDFARSKRQQKVILAVKQKLSSLGTLANPTKINAVIDDVATHMKTNFQLWELLKLAKLYDDIDQTQIATKILDTTEEGLLVSDQTQDGAYILRPKLGWNDFSEIQFTAQNIFNVTAVAKENAKIAIFNGTEQEGLARTTALELESLDYEITDVGNASSQLTTVIYDLSGGTKIKTIDTLTQEIGGTVRTVLPDAVRALLDTTDMPDIVVILGSDILEQDIRGGPVA